ncbi:MAG: response regulator [Bacteroidota bacterium]
MSAIREIKVFIIEDDFVFIEILVNLLESVNSEISNKNIKISYQTFYSTKEASYELSQNPDIVMLDYFLMDDELKADTGTKLLDVIKEYNPDIDVVVVSGQESESVRDELLQKGATNYLGKDENSLKKIKPLIISLIDKELSKS